MVWIACSLLALSTTPPSSSATTPAPPPAASSVTGTQWEARSDNFHVRNYHPKHDARQTAEHCERWRIRLQNYWCGATSPRWTPCCSVVVHAGQASYLACVGAGAAQTFGSSAIAFGAGKKVSIRRIDFRGDHRHGLAAVPHELTHVVLADLLEGRQPPRWADEGMAILADSREKQLLHDRDLADGLTRQLAFRVVDLMALESYPHPARIPAFYGQGASLTAFLAQRDSPFKFVEFLRQSLDCGTDQALANVYAIANVGELERLWHAERQAWRGGYHGLCLATGPDAAPVAETP